MRRVLLAFSFLLAPLSALAAGDRVPAEHRLLPWNAAIPGCQDGSVLGEIASRFADKEARFWNSALTIVGYERIRPLAWRPWGLDTIPRRFCTATATTSDGRKRRVDYSVREGLGVIGATWGVEWCVSGLDRNRAYAPDCRMARP